MRSKNILYILAVVLFWGLTGTSCIQEEFNGGKIAPTGEGYFALNVDLGGLPVSTRGGDEPGTDEELKIHSLRVVLYNGTKPSPGDCNVEYVFDLDVNTPNIVHQFLTEPQRVADKPYKMLVLINGKDVMVDGGKTLYDITNKGNFLHNLNQVANIQIDPLTGTAPNGKGILMSNHQGLVPVSQSQLKKTDTEAVSAPVEVSVDRLVAKVTVKYGDNFTVPPGIDAQSARWGLAITNKETYWVRKGISNETTQAGMANLYAEDPNYSLINIDLENHFNHLMYDSDGSVTLSGAAVTNRIKEYEYVLENTISAETKEQQTEFLSQATHVVVGYKYTPEGFNATDSYYIFNGQVISVSDMNMYRTEENVPPALTGLNEAIKMVNKKGIYPLDGTGTQYFETCGIRFCPQGQVYYYFPIRHFNKSEDNLGYYGVVRNNIYEITINSISVPENSNQYLSAEINIQPWNMREQSNKIGLVVSERKWVTVKVSHHLYFGGENLYSLWTGKNFPPALEYQTIASYVGFKITGNAVSMQDSFREMPSYEDIYYTYSVPSELIVSENAEDNVIDLIYTRTYASTVMINHIPICFIKEDGTVLKVRGTDIDKLPFTANPANYYLNIALGLGSSEDKSYVFFKHIPTLYDMTITDSSNKEYEITTNSDCARYYDSNIAVSGGKITWKAPLTLMSEPVHIGSRSGSIQGGTGIAIICTPKP